MSLMDQGMKPATVAQGMFGPSSWLPLSRSVYELRERLASRKLPTVGDLVIVHQGARTGDNLACVIPPQEWEALPASEKAFFRPAAGQGVIRDGQLIRGEYVFYPYGPEGPLIKHENELLRDVPQLWEKTLNPRRSRLERRAGTRRWWLLMWERSWQWKHEPEIVSTYSGLPGSFSYYDRGDHVVLQGHGWLWRKRLAPNSGLLAVFCG
jgi:hypothetical protein